MSRIEHMAPEIASSPFVIINIETFCWNYQRAAEDLMSQGILRPDECLAAYDWVVCKAVGEATRNNHSRMMYLAHDIYKLMYEHNNFGDMLSDYIRQKLQAENIRFQSTRYVKCMVNGPMVVVVKGE